MVFFFAMPKLYETRCHHITAHFENNDTATYKVFVVPADIRLCLTGTPMENHLGELKYSWLPVAWLFRIRRISKKFIEPSQRQEEVEQTLQKLIYPFKMRRIKSEVLKDLPEKVEDKRHQSFCWSVKPTRNSRHKGPAVTWTAATGCKPYPTCMYLLPLPCLTSLQPPGSYLRKCRL